MTTTEIQLDILYNNIRKSFFHPLKNIQLLIKAAKDQFQIPYDCQIVLYAIKNNALFEIGNMQTLKGLSKVDVIMMKKMEKKPSIKDRVDYGNKQSDRESCEVNSLKSNLRKMIQKSTEQILGQSCSINENSIWQQLNVKQASIVQKEIQEVSNLDTSSNKGLFEQTVANKYRCYACHGTGQRKDRKGKIKNCKICYGDKYISSNHEFVKFINEIIYDQIKTLPKSNLFPRSNQTIDYNSTKYVCEEIIETMNQSSTNELPFSYRFLEEPKKYFGCQFGDEYCWKLHFKNDGFIEWPANKISLYKVGKKVKQIIQVRSLKPDQACELIFVFRAQEENAKIVRNYRFGYLGHNNEIQFVGNQFGYQINTFPDEDQPFENKHTKNQILIKFKQSQTIKYKGTTGRMIYDR